MTICKDVAANAVDHRVIGGYGGIRAVGCYGGVWIYAEHFTFIRAPVLGCDLFRSWKLLGLVIQAVKGEVILALVTYCVI
jgi:hypothetical protein